jgi:hypothetical protein
MCKGETQPCGTEKKNDNEWNFNKTRLPNPQHSTVHATVCQNSGSDSFCPHNHTGSRVQTALPHTRNQGFPKYDVSKLHYSTHGTKGFPSTRCPNCTTAHTEPRVSRFQTAQLLSEPRATQAEPGFIPSLIYNTNKKTGWRNRSTCRILKGGQGDSLDNRNLNKPKLSCRTQRLPGHPEPCCG